MIARPIRDAIFQLIALLLIFFGTLVRISQQISATAADPGFRAKKETSKAGFIRARTTIRLPCGLYYA